MSALQQIVDESQLQVSSLQNLVSSSALEVCAVNWLMFSSVMFNIVWVIIYFLLWLFVFHPTVININYS